MLFVYALEENPTFSPAVRRILQSMIERGDTLCTSVFSVGEVLAGPRKLSSHSGADRVKQFFASKVVEVLPFNLDTADRFSVIRAETGARPADAIHLATAVEAHADLFLTNDKKLHNMRIRGIPFIAGLDGKIF
jgi:predicted nucleic acid-binding protein